MLIKLLFCRKKDTYKLTTVYSAHWYNIGARRFTEEWSSTTYYRRQTATIHHWTDQQRQKLISAPAVNNKKPWAQFTAKNLRMKLGRTWDKIRLRKNLGWACDLQSILGKLKNSGRTYAKINIHLGRLYGWHRKLCKIDKQWRRIMHITLE